MFKVSSQAGPRLAPQEVAASPSATVRSRPSAADIESCGVTSTPPMVPRVGPRVIRSPGLLLTSGCVCNTCRPTGVFVESCPPLSALLETRGSRLGESLDGVEEGGLFDGMGASRAFSHADSDGKKKADAFASKKVLPT